jgi:hypothetical protein
VGGVFQRVRIGGVASKQASTEKKPFRFCRLLIRRKVYGRLFKVGENVIRTFSNFDNGKKESDGERVYVWGRRTASRSK